MNDVPTYFDWPPQNVFAEHISMFRPCIIKRATFQKHPSLDELKCIESAVDVSCADLGEHFVGNPLQREKVTMKLSSFIEGHQSMKAGRCHWFNDTDLNFYLSQCCIYSNSHTEPVTVTGLQNSVAIPPCIHHAVLHQINIWLNTLPCKSSLHYDRNHNLLYVASGAKTVTLIAPAMTPHLAACSAFSSAPNHSTLAFDAVERLMEAAAAPSVGGIRDHGTDRSSSSDGSGNGGGFFYRCLVAEGDALFIPEGWWHQVSSDTCTYAINFWFASSLRAVFDAGMECYVIRAALQELALTITAPSSDSSTSPTRQIIATTENMCSNNRTAKRKIDEVGVITTEPPRSSWYRMKCFTIIALSELIDSIISTRSRMREDRSCGAERTVKGEEEEREQQRHLNDLCLRLVDCDHECMQRYWAPFARQYPSKWTLVLLSLTDESCARLTEIFERISDAEAATIVSSLDITDALRTSPIAPRAEDSFFETIFSPCGNSIPLVRRHLILGNDAWTARLVQPVLQKIMCGAADS